MTAFLPAFTSSCLCPFSASWQLKFSKPLLVSGNSHGSKLTSTFLGAWYCSISLLVPKAVLIRACFLSVLSLIIDNLEESAHMVVELTNQKSAGQAGKLAGLAVIAVVMSLKAVWSSNSFLFGGLLFSLLRPSAHWMRPTNIMKTSLFSLKSTDLKLITSSPNLQSSVG